MSAWGLALPLIENLSNIGGTGDAARERQRKDAESDYLAMERQGIGARVEGAKAAGLHPLAALGFQSGPSPTSVAGGTDFGKVAHMLPKGKDEVDPNDAFRNAQIRLMHAQADEAESRARASYQALATQPGNAPPTISTQLPTERENLSTTGKPLTGVKIVPNEIEASAKGRTIGTHPGGTSVKIPGGPTIDLPSKAFSERTDDMELLKYAAIATMNKDRLLRWIGDITGLGDVAFDQMMKKQKAQEKRDHDYYRAKEFKNYRARQPK